MNGLTAFSRTRGAAASVLESCATTTAPGRMPWFEKSPASAAIGPAHVPRSEHSGWAAGAAADSAWCISHVALSACFAGPCTRVGRCAWAAQQSLGKRAEYDATWHRSHAIVQRRSRPRTRVISATLPSLPAGHRTGKAGICPYAAGKPLTIVVNKHCSHNGRAKALPLLSRRQSNCSKRRIHDVQYPCSLPTSPRHAHFARCFVSCLCAVRASAPRGNG
jgi:hypothetical protein